MPDEDDPWHDGAGAGGCPYPAGSAEAEMWNTMWAHARLKRAPPRPAGEARTAGPWRRLVQALRRWAARLGRRPAGPARGAPPVLDEQRRTRGLG